MKRLVAISAIALICLSAVAIAGGDTKSVTGTIASVDMTAKSMVIRDDKGKDVTVFWKDDTAVSGELREGQPVRVDCKEQDGKTWATSIQVQAKKPY
jgi:hypothetical protein